MRMEIHNLEEMTESRELLEATAKPIFQMLLYLLLAIVVGAFVWSYFGTIDTYVEVKGVVRPEGHFAVVKATQSGVVKKVAFKMGDQVHRGDLLFTMEDSAVEVKLQAIQSNVAKVNHDLAALQELRDRLLKGNSDRRQLEAERVSALAAANITSRYLTEWLDVEQAVRTVEANVEDLKTFEQSVKQNQNLFKNEASKYVTAYKGYQLKRDSAELETPEANQKARDLLQNETLASIQTEMRDQTELSRQAKAKQDAFFVELQQDIQKQKDQVQELSQGQKEMELAQQQLTIMAPSDGVVNILAPLTAGDFLQAGQEILTLVPQATDQYVFQALLSDQDVQAVHRGDVFRIRIPSLADQGVGELSGTLRTISEDAVVDQQNGASRYLTESSFPVPLDTKGKEISIKPGTSAQGHLITGSKTILTYVLEKLGLRNSK